MSDFIRQMQQRGSVPQYVPKKYATDIDLPGSDMGPHPEGLRELERTLRDQMQHRNKLRGTPPREDRLQNPKTKEDWFNAYRKGYAT